MDFSNLVTPELAQSLLGIVSMFLVYAIQRLGAYLKTKTDDTKINSAIQIMDKILVTAVKKTEQTLKKDFVKKSSNRQLTPGQQKELRDTAVNILHMNLADSAKKEILKVIPDIQEYALHKVEDIVHDIKISKGAEVNIISVVDDAIKRGTIKSIPRMAKNDFGLNTK